MLYFICYCVCNEFGSVGLQDSKPVKLSNVRTTKMNDGVQAVVISPDAKYIAVALFDFTVKV